MHRMPWSKSPIMVIGITIATVAIATAATVIVPAAIRAVATGASIIITAAAGYSAAAAAGDGDSPSSIGSSEPAGGGVGRLPIVFAGGKGTAGGNFEIERFVSTG